MSKGSKEIYQFGAFRLDVGEHILHRTDRQRNCALPEKAFQTLVTLVRNPGSLMTKGELLDAVWPDSFVEENNLDKAIHHIRQALGEGTDGQKFVETVRKHGYRFIAQVDHVDIATSDIGVELTSEPARPEPLIEPAAAPDDHPETLSDDPDKNEYLQGDDKTPGRWQSPYIQAGTAAAFIVVLGLGVWSLVGAGQPTPAGGVSVQAGRRSPAYDLYVRGKVKVASENREDTEAAINMLEEAVAVDPNFAEAYAALARGYNTMAFKYSSTAEQKRFHENAEVAIEKALLLKPDLAEGHFARGLILWTNTKGFPHEKAVQSYKRSIALDPDLDETYHQLSLVYSHIGLIDEAEASVRSALEINPNNTLARFRAGVYLQYQGKFDDAAAIFKTIPRDHTPLLMERSIAETLIQAGRLEEAEAITADYLQRFPKDDGGSFTSVKALLLAKAGDDKGALESIERAVEIGSGFGHFHHSAYNIASAYAAMGRPDEAVKWLNFAAENGFPNYPYFQIDPNLDGIRDHPGYVDFMSRLRPQWERYEQMD